MPVEMLPKLKHRSTECLEPSANTDHAEVCGSTPDQENESQPSMWKHSAAKAADNLLRILQEIELDVSINKEIKKDLSGVENVDANIHRKGDGLKNVVTRALHNANVDKSDKCGAKGNDEKNDNRDREPVSATTSCAATIGKDKERKQNNPKAGSSHSTNVEKARHGPAQLRTAGVGRCFSAWAVRQMQKEKNENRNEPQKASSYHKPNAKDDETKFFEKSRQMKDMVHGEANRKKDSPRVKRRPEAEDRDAELKELQKNIRASRANAVEYVNSKTKLKDELERNSIINVQRQLAMNKAKRAEAEAKICRHHVANTNTKEQSYHDRSEEKQEGERAGKVGFGEPPDAERRLTSHEMEADLKQFRREKNVRRKVKPDPKNLSINKPKRAERDELAVKEHVANEASACERFNHQEAMEKHDIETDVETAKSIVGLKQLRGVIDQKLNGHLEKKGFVKTRPDRKTDKLNATEHKCQMANTSKVRKVIRKEVRNSKDEMTKIAVEVSIGQANGAKQQHKPPHNSPAKIRLKATPKPKVQAPVQIWNNKDPKAANQRQDSLPSMQRKSQVKNIPCGNVSVKTGRKSPQDEHEQPFQNGTRPTAAAAEKKNYSTSTTRSFNIPKLSEEEVTNQATIQTNDAEKRQDKANKITEEKQNRHRSDEQLKLVENVLQYSNSASEKNAHYKVLGISTDASNADIRRAYRKLSLKIHPDKNKAEKAAEAFQAVAFAYGVLMSPGKRAKYDQGQRNVNHIILGKSSSAAASSSGSNNALHSFGVIPAGTCITINARFSHLNGTKGSILKFDPQTSLYTVSLDLNDGSTILSDASALFQNILVCLRAFMARELGGIFLVTLSSYWRDGGLYQAWYCGNGGTMMTTLRHEQFILPVGTVVCLDGLDASQREYNARYGTIVDWKELFDSWGSDISYYEVRLSSDVSIHVRMANVRL